MPARYPPRTRSRTRPTDMTTRRDMLKLSASAIAMAALPGCGARLPPVPIGGPVRDLLADQVADGKIPGAVWLVAQGEEVVVHAAGVTAIEGKEPMRRDTVFRIASMTKPITATAVMMLAEEEKLALDTPAEKWLPELANRRVLKRIDGAIDDTVPAERAITVRDLMTFTLGFGVLFDPAPPIQRAIDDLQLVNGAPVPMTPHGPDEWMRRFSTLPLMHQPGAQWMYNTGSLLQSVLVRRASGRDFDAFVRERIIGPLEMRDTDFFVAPEKLGRFAGCGYFTDPKSGKKTRMDRDGAESAYARPPAFPSGAGGLVSTVDDFLVFARMLMNAGVHNGRRILSEHSVRQMTTDHLSATQKAASASAFFPKFFVTNGWGFGLSVVTAPDAISRVPGRYGWMGGFGTSWFNDPARGLVGIVMTQSSDFLFSGAHDAFWRNLYATIG
jgi:CubicO group peptidase (beta-lactamase class C family)